jgi:hypothetical protein
MCSLPRYRRDENGILRVGVLGESTMKVVRILILSGFLAGSPSAFAACARSNLSHLPLAFELNRGPAADQVRYLARGPGYEVFLTASEAVLSRNSSQGRSSVTMRIVGADPGAAIAGTDALPATANYFVGNDPKRWRREVPTYAKVRYRQVYPGIDVVYYGNARQLEYDFVLAPNANAHRIALEFSGAEPLRVDAHGNMVHARSSELLQRRPVAWQQFDGLGREVDVR